MKFTQWLEEINQMPDSKKFSYLGCVLTEDSQKNLIGLTKRLYFEQNGTEIPSDWTYKAHHMTVKFKPQIEDMRNYSHDFGKSIELYVTGFATDSNCVAVVVASKILVTNAVPHITVAHSKQVSPVYSNTLLMDRKNIQKVKRFELNSVFLAVEPNQTKHWPETNFKLAAPTLI